MITLIDELTNCIDYSRDREQYIVLQYIAIGIAIVLYWWGELKGIAIGMGGGGSHNTIAIYCNILY